MYFFRISFVRMAAPAPPTARIMLLRYSSSMAASEMCCREYTTQRACAEYARCWSETTKGDLGSRKAPAAGVAGTAEGVALGNME